MTAVGQTRQASKATVIVFWNVTGETRGLIDHGPGHVGLFGRAPKQPRGPAGRGPGRPIVQRVATVTGCMKFFTTYSPMLRPISSPTRVENR